MADSRLENGPGAEEGGGLRHQLRPLAPPARLEGRVTRSLAGRGLLASRMPGSRAMLAAAAALVVFATGFVAGTASTRGRAAAAPDGPRFALLLYEGSDPAPPVDDVAEHTRWARALAERGHEVSGEKLGAAVTSVPDAPTPLPATLEGFFLISAPSAAAAADIARTLPHVRHGGRVVVRAIDPT